PSRPPPRFSFWTKRVCRAWPLSPSPRLTLAERTSRFPPPLLFICCWRSPPPLRLARACFWPPPPRSARTCWPPWPFPPCPPFSALTGEAIASAAAPAASIHFIMESLLLNLPNGQKGWAFPRLAGVHLSFGRRLLPNRRAGAALPAA